MFQHRIIAIYAWWYEIKKHLCIFSCDQAALWMAQSVCLSVCLSVTTFEMMHEAWCYLGEVPYCFSRSSVKFQGHMVKKNCQIWPRLGKLKFEFTNGYEMMHKAWSSIEEVPCCFSRSSVKFEGHTALKIIEFDPNWAFPDCNSS